MFVNFNPVGDEPWTFEPGREYARHYRLFVYDGSVSLREAEGLWKKYAADSATPGTGVQP